MEIFRNRYSIQEFITEKNIRWKVILINEIKTERDNNSSTNQSDRHSNQNDDDAIDPW